MRHCYPMDLAESMMRSTLSTAKVSEKPVEANATEHGVGNASGSTVQQPSTTTFDVAQAGEATATEHGVRHANEAIDQQPLLTGAAEQGAKHVMQCPACKRVLCQSSDLAFFHRVNKAGRTEVHLMLKPENAVPPTFIAAAARFPSRGLQTWMCVCECVLGDTRPVADRHSVMTAFKPASVM